MEENNNRSAFVLGAHMREDLEHITQSERSLVGDAGESFDDMSLFQDIQHYNQNFQFFYNYPAGGDIKFRVQILSY